MKSKLNKKKKSGEGRWGPGIDGLLAIEKLFLWGARANESEGPNSGLCLEETQDGLSLVDSGRGWLRQNERKGLWS